MTETERTEIFARIETRLVEATAAETAARAGASTVELDQQSVGRLSRMDALQRQAMARATAARRRAEIQRLRTALARVRAQDFGICADCGEAIGLARLRVDPALARCAGCTRAG